MFRSLSVRISVLGATLMTLSTDAAAEPNGLFGRWEGVATHNGRPWCIAFDAWKESGLVQGTLDFPDAGHYALPLIEMRPISGGQVRLVQERPRATVTIEARKSDGRLTGTLQGFGIEADVVLTKKSAVANRFVEVPIRFRSGGASLVGTLVKPPTPGPHPAIVWTHGSGFVGRQSDPYRMLGYLFARHGIASLLYDKRGVGGSTGRFRDATLDVLAEDALAAVALLKERGDIDATRIGIGGHSQGGWIAPLAASRSDQIAFLVAIAAAGMSPFEQGSFVVENRLRNGGFDDAVIEQMKLLRKGLLHHLRTGENRKDIERQLKEVRRESWYRTALLPSGSLDDFRSLIPNWVLLDPEPMWERVNVPVLAVWGELDDVVPSHRSYEWIEAALRRVGNDRATLVILPNADHNLSLVRPNSEEWDWPRAAPDLEKHIARWAARIKQSPGEHVHCNSGVGESSTEGASERR